MNGRCASSCRRHATTEWIRPGDDSWLLCDPCSTRHAPVLRAQGWTDFHELDNGADETPSHLIAGGPLDADCG